MTRRRYIDEVIEVQGFKDLHLKRHETALLKEESDRRKAINREIVKNGKKEPFLPMIRPRYQDILSHWKVALYRIKAHNNQFVVIASSTVYKPGMSVPIDCKIYRSSVKAFDAYDIAMNNLIKEFDLQKDNPQSAPMLPTSSVDRLPDYDIYEKEK